MTPQDARTAPPPTKGMEQAGRAADPETGHTYTTPWKPHPNYQPTRFCQPGSGCTWCDTHRN